MKLLDYSPAEIRYLLDLAKDFKAMKRAGTPHRYLEGKNIVLLFETPAPSSTAPSRRRLRRISHRQPGASPGWRTGHEMIHILYQDRELAVCRKPAGLLSQDGPGDTLPS